MPRHVKDRYEAAVYCNHRLPAVKAGIEADIERALECRDFVRAHRYTQRLYLVENRFVCSSDQASLRRPMVEAESPPACLPSNAISASSKSPVEFPSGRESGSTPPGSSIGAHREAK